MPSKKINVGSKISISTKKQHFLKSFESFQENKEKKEDKILDNKLNNKEKSERNNIDENKDTKQHSSGGELSSYSDVYSPSKSTGNISEKNTNENRKEKRELYKKQQSQSKKDFINFAQSEYFGENLQFLSDLRHIEKKIQEEMYSDIPEKDEQSEKSNISDKSEKPEKSEPPNRQEKPNTPNKPDKSDTQNKYEKPDKFDKSKDIQMIKKSRDDIETSPQFQKYFKILYETFIAPDAKNQINLALKNHKKLDEIYTSITRKNLNVNSVVQNGDLTVSDISQNTPLFFHLKDFEAAREEIETLVRQNTLMRYNRSGQSIQRSEIKREIDFVSSLINKLNQYLQDHIKDKTEKQSGCCISFSKKKDMKAIYEGLEMLQQELTQILNEAIETQALLRTIKTAYIKHFLLVGKTPLPITTTLENAVNELSKLCSPMLNPLKSPDNKLKRKSILKI